MKLGRWESHHVRWDVLFLAAVKVGDWNTRHIMFEIIESFDIKYFKNLKSSRFEAYTLEYKFIFIE